LGSIKGSGFLDLLSGYRFLKKTCSMVFFKTFHSRKKVGNGIPTAADTSWQSVNEDMPCKASAARCRLKLGNFRRIFLFYLYFTMKRRVYSS
jgi:hypothetical protein